MTKLDVLEAQMHRHRWIYDLPEAWRRRCKCGVKQVWTSSPGKGKESAHDAK